MSIPTVDFMLNIVQIMFNHLKESSSNIAVHCHAGLGRTGLTIACYLIYQKNLTPEEAIMIVRSARPGSLQTKVQIKFVSDFQVYLNRLLVVFPVRFVDGQLTESLDKCSLLTMIQNQRLYYHTEDLKLMNYELKVSMSL